MGNSRQEKHINPNNDLNFINFINLNDLFEDVEDFEDNQDENGSDDDFEGEIFEEMEDEGTENQPSLLEVEICLMNQAIDNSGLELSKILSAIAWIDTHNGTISPCLECLNFGWSSQTDEQPDIPVQPVRDGQVERFSGNGLGRCSKHVNYNIDDDLPELEEVVFPNYLEIMGEVWDYGKWTLIYFVCSFLWFFQIFQILQVLLVFLVLLE